MFPPNILLKCGECTLYQINFA